MRRCFILLLSVLVLYSCKKDDEPAVKEPADRTVLVYFLTKGLSSDLRNNVVTMFEGLQKTEKTSTLLIYWDNNDKSFDSPRILKYESDGYGGVNGISFSQYTKAIDSQNSKIDYIIGLGKVVKEYPSDQDATEPHVITSVLDDMIRLSPNKEYGLIFGSHAEAWLPASNTRSRAFASAYKYPINIDVLKETLLRTDCKFKFIIMDACMMGSIEVAYELHNTCDYYVASPMEVPSSGFPYNVITPYLYSDKIDDYTLNVCDAYSNYYTQEQNWGCCAAVNCNELPDLVKEIGQYINEYSAMDLSSVQKYYKEYYDDRYNDLSYDILDFLNKFTGGNLSSSLITQLNRTIIAKSFVISAKYNDFPSFKDVDTSKLCGMGMYVPQKNRKEWNEYLMTLMWTDESGWGSYIDDIYD